MSKKRLCFVVPRGEVIRNFLYTGILKKLSNDCDVHLIAVTPNKNLKQNLESISSTYYDLEEFRLSYTHRYLLGLLDLAHNKYMWSQAAKVRWTMRDVEANSLSKRIKRLANKNIAKLFAQPKRLKVLERLLYKHSINEYAVAHYIDILGKIKPDFIFNGSHSHSKNAYPVIQAAKQLGIKTGTFLFSWDNLTSQGRIIPPYDYYFAWNTDIKGDLLRLYPDIKTNQIFVTGTPQFSFHFDSKYHIQREEFLNHLGIPSDGKYIIYSSGMSHHMPYEPEVAEIVADILKKVAPDVHLVIRTYAKDKGDVFKELKARRKDIIIPEVKWEKNFQTPLKEDQVFFTNLLRHCELGVNVASTISLELCMLNKPAINIGFNPPGRDIYPYDYTRFYEFDHYKPIVQSKAVIVAKNTNELENILAKYLENTTLDQQFREELISDFFPGNSLTSAVEAIPEIILKLTATHAD